MNANIKHHAALTFISVGILGAVVGGIALVTGIVYLKAAAIVCGAFGFFPSLFVLRQGWRMRTRAIEAGSTAHLEKNGDVWTAHTEAAKPSFLKDKRKPRDDDW